MFKETLTFENFNGETITRDYYFNLTVAECTELEHSKLGGWHNYVERIVQTYDNVALMDMLKDLIKRSYGVKSDDGMRFMKSPEIYREFIESEAYSALLIKIFDSQENITAFVNGIMPPPEKMPKFNEKFQAAQK